VEDPNAKNSPAQKEPVDLPVGGEGREDQHKRFAADVWNRIMSNLWRSDAGISGTRYNGSDAASEVS